MVIDCANRSALVSNPGMPLGQLVTILSSLMPCAIAGVGKLPTDATAAVAPSSTSRRRAVIAISSLRQRQPPGVAVAGFRQLAPIHHTSEKGHVAVVNLAGQRILGGSVGKHLFA